MVVFGSNLTKTKCTAMTKYVVNRVIWMVSVVAPTVVGPLSMVKTLPTSARKIFQPRLLINGCRFYQTRQQLPVSGWLQHKQRDLGYLSRDFSICLLNVAARVLPSARVSRQLGNNLATPWKRVLELAIRSSGSSGGEHVYLFLFGDAWGGLLLYGVQYNLLWGGGY